VRRQEELGTAGVELEPDVLLVFVVFVIVVLFLVVVLVLE